MHRYKELEIWKKSRLFCSQIYEITSKFPSDEKFGLTNQYVGKQYLDNTEMKDLQLKDYLLTDFNAQYDFKIKKHEVVLKLLVNNIFNQKYVNNGYVYNGPIYFSQAGTNFMFGISWKIQ